MSFPQRAGGANRTQAFSIDLFDDGSSLLCGMFFGTANFGDSISLSVTNDADGFTAKLNADGSFAWATKVGGTSSVRVSDVAALSDGSSIITGLWSGTATFGASSYTSNPTNYNDAFIAKLDSNGNYLWVTQAGGTASDEPAAITTLSDGSSLITGSFSGTADFGSTSLTSTNGLREIFIAKLDADGDFIWATKAGGGGHDHGKDIIALPDGSSIITGDFASNATFGSDTLEQRGSSSAFIAKLDANGNFVWATKAGEPNCCSADSVYGYGASALSDGSSLITGKFKGSVNFGDNALTSEGSTDDIFVAKIDSDGDFVWVSQAGGTSTELGQSITALSDGSSLITGKFQGTVTFGSTTLSSTGSDDIFVAKLDADGTFLWATKAGGTSSDYGIKIDSKSDGSSIIAGDINGTASFGSSDLTSPGNSDAFAAAMGANGSWTSSLVSQPSLTSATYNASSGALAVTGANLAANSGSSNDIDISKLTLTGEGSNTYTLTSGDVELTSATAFSITLNAADQLQVAGLLNKDGTSSGGGTSYNIAAALNWNPGASSSPADSTGNAVTVSNVSAPSLSSATYNDSTGVLALTGSNLPAYPGSSNDIDVSKLTITGGSGSTYTLTTSDVELTSATAASITLNSSDQTNLDSLLNKNGTASTQGTTYNIAAADDWAPGADSSTDIADLTGNVITVSGINNAPVLTAPSAGVITETTGSADTTTSGLTGTLSASDADGDTLTYGITGGTVASGTSTLAGTYGSLAVNTTTGAYTYTPTSAAIEALCAGVVTDSFTVSVSDGTETANSNYSIAITGADDPAVISGDVTGAGTEDTSAITGTLSATDVEGLADNTYFTVSTTPSQGTALIDAANGDWSYTPTANFNGSDSFTVTVTDDCDGTTTQPIALTINAVDDPAVISGDTSGSGSEDNVISGDLNATDADGLTDNTYFSIESSDVPSNGTASINAETGAWSYTPSTNFNGSDSFTVTITDDLGGTTTQAIALTINAVDDPATISGDTSSSGPEDNAITGTLAATDPEGLIDGTYFSIESSDVPSNGTASINAETGAWSYTPSTNFNGSDSFTVTITDDLGGTTTQAIALTVTPDPTPEPTPEPDPATEPQPDTETSDDFIIVASTSSPSDDDETADTGSQTTIESQVITNTSSTQTGTAALVENSGNNDNLVTATLPPGVSITTEGSVDAHSTSAAQDTLIASIDARDSSSEAELINAATVFTQQLPQTSRVDVRTIIPTATSTATRQPIVITGTTPPPTSADSTQTEAFVIDLRQMPSAATTRLQLHNINYSVIIGPAEITGGNGRNIVHADNAPQLIILGTDDDTLNGGGGDDTIGSAAGHDLLIGGQGRDLITGGTDNDTLQGGSQADTLTGGTGDDSLSGGQGQDSLQGSSGDDVLNGDAKHDMLKGGGGNDSLLGGTGKDTLQGSSGDDVLNGDARRDRLKGGSGNDTLNGGRGIDILIGGDGSDVFELSMHKDTIKGFSIADGDVIEAPNNLKLGLIQRGDHLLLKNEGNNIKTTLLNVNRDELLRHQPDLI